MTLLAGALPAVMEFLAVGLLVTMCFAALALWQTVRTLSTRRLVSTADYVIETVVCSLMQLVVDDIKARPSAKPYSGQSAKPAGGKLTPEEADQIKRVAVSRARELLGESSIKKLNSLFQNFDLFLSDRIEFFVRANRSAQ